MRILCAAVFALFTLPSFAACPPPNTQGDGSTTWCIPGTLDGNGIPLGMGGGRIPSTFYVLKSPVTNNSASDVGAFASGAGPGPTVPAGATYEANTYRLTVRGTYSTGLANVSASTIKVKFGGTTVASLTTSALPISISAYPYFAQIDCTVLAGGTTVWCGGTVTFWTVLANTPSIQLPIYSSSPVTFNPAVANAWQVTSALTSLIGSPSITANSGMVEILY